MRRVALALLGLSLACGSARSSQPQLSFALGTSQFEMRADDMRTIELLVVGPGASDASFSAQLPAFAVLEGALLTLTPTGADTGTYALLLTATAAGQSATTTLTVTVTDLCGGCPVGETCGGGGTPGVCSTPRWSRWAAAVSTQGDDNVDHVAVDALGNVHVAGTTDGQDVFIQEYGSDGTPLLDKRWPSPTRIYLSGLAVVPSGGTVLSFTVRCPPSSTCDGPDLGAGAPHGMAIARLDVSGAVLWQLDSGPLDAQGVGAEPGYERPAVGPTGAIAVEGWDATGMFIAQLDPDEGHELWRQSKGSGHWGASVAVDGAGHVTALSFSQDIGTTPTLEQYDSSGKTVWQVKLTYPMFGAIAAAGDGTIALTDSWQHFNFYRGSDGALVQVIGLPDIMNPSVAANANRVAVLGNSAGYNCAVPRLATYDLTGRLLSTLTLANGCTGPAADALALAPGGDVIVGGGFNVPFDFDTGTNFAPRGWDGFLVDVKQ